MLHTEWKDAVITYATVDDLTAEVDLERVCDGLLIIVPTIDTAQLTIYVSDETGGTFQILHITDPADGGDNDVISASGTGGFTWVVPLGGFQYIKIKTSAAQTADRTFKVCGTRS